MNRKEAEDYIYKSYLKAEKFQDYNEKDEMKRNPQFSRKIIEDMCGTPCVVVTGSKGKGSVSCMISQIMQSRKRVGLMTSPHLVNFCERFKVNGHDMTDEEFVEHIKRIKVPFDRVENKIAENECVSPMGIQAALALSYFNESLTEFNVFECGKGAKFDDVTNIRHEYAVINSIFLEHTRELGANVAEIADNKAAVITGTQKCVYVASQKPEALEVIKKHAAEKNVPLKIYGKDFYAKNIKYTNSGMVFDVVIGSNCYSDVMVPLLGEHQAKNCALALALCEDVLGELQLDRVKEKLSNMDWSGRMEVLSSNPFLLLDACINRESCDDIIKVLQQIDVGKVTVIVGIPDDKDFLGVVRGVQEIAEQTIITRSQNPHYKFTEVQAEILEKESISVISTFSIEDALKIAGNKKKSTIILGTTSLISDVKKLQYENKLMDIYCER